jgi:uncharacterized glyoxalase superfamily protein PhnB
MIAFHKIMPVLRVTDLERAASFYTDVLGFTVCWRNRNDGGGDNIMLESGDTSVLLSTGAHLGDTPLFTGTLYFNVTGVQELFERIKDRVDIVWPLENREYGQKEFGIRDCDGYLLAFAEELAAEK